MKKVFIITIILVLLCGCDPYVYKQPYNYENSVWVCKDPPVIYSVNTDSNDTAKTVIDEKEISFVLGFISDTAEAWEYTEENGEIVGNRVLFSGTCKYSATEFTVKIDKDSDILFDGEYEELVFVREEK